MNKIKKNLPQGTLIVDIDGTICEKKLNNQSYKDLIPNKKILEKLKEYKKKGYKILLFTSRNMRTYKSNLGEINKYTALLFLNGQNGMSHMMKFFWKAMA